MTFHATIFSGKHMGVWGEHLLSDSGMTGEAQLRALGIFLAMARGAGLFIWRMEILSYETFTAAAMGIMAGEALADLIWKALVAFQAVRLSMATQAKRITVLFQELIIISIMRLMAGDTVSAGRIDRNTPCFENRVIRFFGSAGLLIGPATRHSRDLGGRID